MLEALKRGLARKLCPEVFADAERWRHAEMMLSDINQWCSVDFPMIGDAVKWVLGSVRIQFMSLDAYYAMTVAERLAGPNRIDAFREDLRRLYLKAPAPLATPEPPR